MTRVEFHPVFADQFTQLCSTPGSEDIAGEVSALISALEKYGHELEGYGPDDTSHPVSSSRLKMFALRRHPPTRFLPYATLPPTLRIPYVWFVNPQGEEFAVVMLMGDKTDLGNAWYPPVVARIESDYAPSWSREHPTDRALRSRR